MVEVVAALIWQGERFMICRRPAHKACGLLWEFVGGKVEPGETKAEALVRECREELDITVDVGAEFMSVTHTYPDITVHLTLFHATVKEGVPKLLEHADMKWITPAEIPQYDFCPADEEILCEIIRLSDLHRAMRMLHSGGHTCVMCRGEETYAVGARGVKPLVTWYVSRGKFTDFSAADKVVGRGAAFLYVLLDVKMIYADVISAPALEVLKQAGIETRYKTLVPNIINRAGNGVCPFEMAVADITDPTDAYRAIRSKMEEMGIDLHE